MNSNHLREILNPLVPSFLGVFSADTLPKSLNPESIWCMVVNTANSDESGDHWVGLYHTGDRKTRFFCSYGSNPFQKEQIPQSIANMIHNLQGTVQYNRTRLRSDCTSICGQYTILFILSMEAGVSYDSFLQLFHSSCQICNDIDVAKTIQNLFDIQFTKHDIEWMRNRESICQFMKL